MSTKCITNILLVRPYTRLQQLNNYHQLPTTLLRKRKKNIWNSKILNYDTANIIPAKNIHYLVRKKILYLNSRLSNNDFSVYIERIKWARKAE